MLRLCKLIVFLAAFLLFQIELIVSKTVLPGFGGSYMVWCTCMIFFQGMLLLGYIYAYGINLALSPKRSYPVCLAVLILPIFFFPLKLTALYAPAHDLPSVIEIALLFSQTIGMAFLVLSSISTMTQNYMAASILPQSNNPYILYATSNLGAFCALATYPFLFEPLFDLDVQVYIWQGGYLLLVILGFAGIFSGKHLTGTRPLPPAGSDTAVSFVGRLHWFLLSTAGSAMFLAVTNTITFDLAAVPLLWILPLCIYLLSFVLAFKQRPWFPDWLHNRFPMVVTIGTFLFIMMIQSYKLPVQVTLPVHLIILFAVCLTCHGELNKHRPLNPAILPGFYITIALGGFFGSVLVNQIMPLISAHLMEYMVAMLLAAGAMALKSDKWRVSFKSVASLFMLAVLIVCWPVALGYFGHICGTVIAVCAGILLALTLYRPSKNPPELFLAMAVIICVTPLVDLVRIDRSLLHRHRNFYGIYRVYDSGPKRLLYHGTTLHGSQFLSSSRQKEALTYYHRTTPVGQVLSQYAGELERIAVIGLGSGSLATYATPAQEMDFYELDPYNKFVAEKYFTFLKNCSGKLSLLFGDARLSLSSITDQHYSLIIIDAFNSDSIPLHLITVEAIQEYLRCTSPDGIVLFHVSNKYLNLEPVLYANATRLHIRSLGKTNLMERHPDAEVCKWVAITGNNHAAEKLITTLGWTDFNTDPPRMIRPWTDRYSNILSAIR